MCVSGVGGGGVDGEAAVVFMKLERGGERFSVALSPQRP